MILPDDEFAAIPEAVADVDDLNSLRTAKGEEHDAPTVPLEEVTGDLGLSGWDYD